MIKRPAPQRQNGNVFLVLFGGIAVLGLLGVTVTTLMKGPMASSLKLTRANTAQVQMALASQAAVMTATNSSGAGDCDGDGYIEPMEWRIDATKGKPTGGNLLPANMGVPTVDVWGTDYGYCVWDHGPTALAAGCEQSTPGTDKRLAGTNSTKFPVVAIISAGPDKQFSSTCRTFAAADTNSNGSLDDAGDFKLAQKDSTSSDDLIFTYTYEEASSASGGLWTLKSSDNTTAMIPKTIEAQDAKFTGTSVINSLGAPPPPAADCTGLGSKFYNDPVSGHCYYYDATARSRTGGQTGCQNNGGYLANITSAAEKNLIVSALAPAATSFIGANAISVAGEWRWEGGEENNVQFWSGDNATGSAIPGQYNSWTPGEPQVSAQCVSMTTSGFWNDAACTSNLPSVCEKSPIYRSDCAGLGSAYYNDAASGRCYYTTTTSSNYSAARNTCQSTGAYLATITSANEYSTITTKLNPAVDYWISGSDAQAEGVWLWQDGEETGVQFWAGGAGNAGGVPYNGAYNNWSSTLEPSNSGGVENCLALRYFAAGSKMNDYDCSVSMPAICEKSPGGQSVEFTKGLRIADDSVVTTCNTTNTGVVRRKNNTMEICDGTSWITQGSVAKIDDLSDAYADYIMANLYAGAGSGHFGAVGAAANTGVGAGVLTALYSGSFNSGAGYNALGFLVTGMGNTAIGVLAGGNTNIMNKTTALGYGACGNSTMTVLGSGAMDNTCAGYLAGGKAATVGMSALGAFAAANSTVGMTAVGGNAAFGNTSGTDNTAIGYNSLYTNSTGTDNTAIGALAATNLISNGNTAIGYQALQSHYQGIFSGATAIGSQAGYYTNDRDTYIGFQAGYNKQSAYTFDTAIGYRAGAGTGGQYYSVIVGSRAFENANTNNNVVAVGALAGGKTTSSPLYNVLVGANAGGDATATPADPVIIGSSAARTKPGSQSVIIGKDAQRTATSTDGTTSIGYQADFGNVNAQYFVTIGAQAKYNGASANSGTVIGYQAAYNQTGNGTTAIGYRALYSGTTSQTNTAVGYQSMYSVGAGTDNTAVGYGSLFKITGNKNTAVGHLASAQNTASDNTTSVGYLAGFNNATNNNTNIGAEAGYNATTATNQTAIGYRALYSNVTGNSNTAVGYQAFMKAGRPFGVYATQSTAFGAGAGEKGGSNNMTVVGAFAANALDTNSSVGSDTNTAIGAAAARMAQATASSLSFTALGFQALASSGSAAGTAAGAFAALNSPGPSGNVALGYSALNSSSTSLSSAATALGAMADTAGAFANAITIGYNAQPAGANSVRLGNTDITLIEGTVAFTATSDKRVKKDIAPSDLGLDFILKLKPVSYRLKRGNGRTDYGFLAQDIDDVLGDFGHRDQTNMITRLPDKMRTYQLRSADLLAPITKAIQERQAKIEALTRELDALEADMVNCQRGAQ